MSLSAKKISFCENYVIDFNGAQAAIRAGYSSKAAKEIAARLLTNANIKEYIAHLQKTLSEQTGITAQRVIDELAKIAFNNIQDYIEDANEVADISKIDKDKAASVESIKKTVTSWGSGDTAGSKTSVSLKLHDKISALEKLGRHLGIFEADNKQKPTVIRVTDSDE